MAVWLGFCGGTRAEPKPGILVGAETFTSILVSQLAGGFQSGIYDVEEGLAIAVLEIGKITFLDPKTYAPKRTVPVADDLESSLP